jgi:hypothetical protein
MERGVLPLHAESSVALKATPDVVFGLLDDHLRLSAHMTRRSWMMAGSRMTVEMDEAGGHAIGSMIRLHGRVLGVRLDVEEIVTERTPPFRKRWETSKEPTLLVIGAYRMGFDIAARDEGCTLRVSLDYARPVSGVGRLLGPVFGDSYARWCTRRMTNDAAKLSSREIDKERMHARSGTTRPE